MADSDPPKPHPLEGTDLDKCYDVMMAERTALITAKRETEDELVRTLIKLSSAALLIVPGLVLAKDSPVSHFGNCWIYIGAIGFVASLLCAMLEQFLSSKAYDRQLQISLDYYQRKSELTADARFSALVRGAQTLAFALFALGLISSGIGITRAGNQQTVSNKPTPSPPPRPSPQPNNYPGNKDGGRSVPPAAPPPPPPKR